MSTLDAQILTLGSMLTRDVLDVLRPRPDAARHDVAAGRGFGLAVALAVFALWRLVGESIFSVASLAFSGYVTLVPTLLLGVRWRRFNAAGAAASILGGNALYAAALAAGGGLQASAPSWLGLLPVAWGLLGAVAGALAGAWLAPPPPAAATARAFGDAL